MELWRFQEQLIRRLSGWGIFSLLAGAWLVFVTPLFQSEPELRSLFHPDLDIQRGLGTQFGLWGLINLAIAFFGGVGLHRRKTRLSPEEQLAAVPQERANLARLLWVNTGLDVLYLAGGLLLAQTLGATDFYWRGSGWGIVLQGGFLFFFDLFHLVKLR